MSTHSFMQIVRKGMSFLALSILGGVFALQLLLPPATFASPLSSVGYSFGQAEALDRASVSVVRLVITYKDASSNAGAQCSGLGELVSSSSLANSTSKANWVLTDGALINPTTAVCAAPTSSTSSATPFSSAEVAVYASDAYSADPLNSLLLSTVTLVPTSVKCQKSSCSDGAALFFFESAALEPFLDMTTGRSAQQVGIELTNTTPGSSPLPSQGNVDLAQATQYLTPTQVQPGGSSAKSDLGMPFVDANGDLMGVHLKGGDTFDTAALSRFVASNVSGNALSSSANVLHGSWNAGVTDFYAVPPKYTDALSMFQLAGSLNPQFKAAGTFASQTSAKLNGGQRGVSNTGSKSPTLYGIPLAWLIGAVLVIGFLFLLLLFLLVNLRFGRARALRRAQRKEELARFKADQAEAQRMAELEVKRQQQAQPQQEVPVPVQQASAAESSAPAAIGNQQAAPADQHCPNCGQVVYLEDNFCPNCRYVLSPSASGLHLKATPPQDANNQTPALDSSGDITLPLTPVPKQPEISTQPSVVPASSISDMPTLELSPSKPKNGQSEKTIPSYPVEQFQGHNLSLAVGHRSDVGLKRKHKPNEDSLFAMQGARTHNSQQQLFGLFVVADGMGGHASGKDASQLAIQTIIDYVIPRVYSIESMDDDAFLKLLVEGVQCANQAVHKRNLEERADMGTTMTAAMVVGSTAYVANVGDSRTYLYREPEGLAKITHDHSVVASLVDAGLIKPDDIYTHPKRNQIYRSLGEKPFVEVDAFTVPLYAHDKLLLCSDGLWDMVRDTEIQRLLSNDVPDPSKTGNALIQAALDSGGDDNVSVIVVDITETTDRTGMTGIQLLAKPESVNVPDIPQP